MHPQTCHLIGAPVQSGASQPGCIMGPDAFRTAGLGRVLSALGHRVDDRGNVAPGPAAKRHHPNTAIRALDEPSAWIAALRRFLPPLTVFRRWGPSFEDRHLPTCPWANSASSIEEPPISQTRPLASGQPKSTPCAESRASSSPSMIHSFNPVSRSTSSQNSAPTAASRTAAVATTAAAVAFTGWCRHTACHPFARRAAATAARVIALNLIRLYKQ